MLNKIMELLQKENIHQYRIIKTDKQNLIYKKVFGVYSTNIINLTNYLQRHYMKKPKRERGSLFSYAAFCCLFLFMGKG